MTGTLPPLLDSVVGGRTPERRCFFAHMDPSLLCQGKGLVFPNLTIDETAKRCQRFGHSQTSCRGQLICSRCASVGHTSTDCILEPKCINCSQPHSADSKLCPKWRTEKQIQEIKNKNISYSEARKLIVTQTSQTYAQVAKTSTATTATQTDDNITEIVCPPFKLLQPLIYIPKASISSSVPAVTKFSTSTQAQLLPSTSSVTVTSSSKSQSPIPLVDIAPTTSNSLFTSAASSSSTASMFTPLPVCPVLQTTITTSNATPSISQDTKLSSKLRKKNVHLKTHVLL
ncbi:uncharacterized protein TNCV_4771261 [Trichonephila clavipes]|nr:uncharacterized protein TNCV_4771261 [Trichonephila clavipes]